MIINIPERGIFEVVPITAELFVLVAEAEVEQRGRTLLGNEPITFPAG